VGNASRESGAGSTRPGQWNFASASGKAFIVLCWLAFVLGAVMFLKFDPSESRFLPRCVFHSLTGLYCPGCGTTRAFHALVHGDFAAALRDNLFFAALLPVILWLLAIETGGAFFGWRPRLRPAPAALLWTLLAALIAFTVLRNIPIPAFEFLRPR